MPLPQRPRAHLDGLIKGSFASRPTGAEQVHSRFGERSGSVLDSKESSANFSLRTDERGRGAERGRGPKRLRLSNDEESVPMSMSIQWQLVPFQVD
jgi:hypothetical protein